MNKLTILIFLILFSFTSMCKESKELRIRRQIIFLISLHTEISMNNRVKLIAQSALETGHYKHIKYKNNVFNMKKVVNHKLSYGRYINLKENIESRIKLFKKKHYKFTRDYATDPNYSNKLKAVFNYVNREYDLNPIKNESIKICFPQINWVVIPFRYRFNGL